MQVKDLMKRKVITARENDSVRDVCKLLTKNKISGVPPVLTKAGRLAGFVSERDIIPAVYKKDFLAKTAKQLMTKRVRTITEDQPLTHAAKVFTEERYRHLPVVRSGKVVGVITRNDVTTHMMKHYY